MQKSKKKYLNNQVLESITAFKPITKKKNLNVWSSTLVNGHEKIKIDLYFD